MKRLPITNAFDGSPVFYLPQTNSTMLDAARLSAEGAKSGTVIVAGYQSSGRGRFVTRKWISAPGEGLLFTLMLDPSVLKGRAALTPLLAGLGVANFAERSTGRPCSVKWPNDVVAAGGKVSGILCEFKGAVVYVGIGINCLKLRPCEGQANAENDAGGGRTSDNPAPDQSPSGAPPHHSLPRVSLAELGATEAAPLSILEEVLFSLREAFLTADPLEKISAKLYLKGQQVQVISGVSDTQQRVIGVLEGLGSAGQLLVRESKSNRLLEIYSGELAVPGSR